MKKVSPEIDLAILEGLAAGYTNKQLAEIHKVSPSYISKLKNGKKIPYIHVSNPTLIKDEFFEVYNTNLTEVLAYLECKDIIVNKNNPDISFSSQHETESSYPFDKKYFPEFGWIKKSRIVVIQMKKKSFFSN